MQVHVVVQAVLLVLKGENMQNILILRGLEPWTCWWAGGHWVKVNLNALRDALTSHWSWQMAMRAFARIGFGKPTNRATLARITCRCIVVTSLFQLPQLKQARDLKGYEMWWMQ
jgi:hypothetical protein